jgi:hypothetical protein
MSRDPPMADGVDTTMHTVQAANEESVLDNSPSESERLELPPRDDAVLPGREPRDGASPGDRPAAPRPTTGAFAGLTMTVMGKVAHPLIRADEV